jgi:hypothetical protein
MMFGNMVKFILKNGRVIYFDSYNLGENDISFLKALKT